MNSFYIILGIVLWVIFAFWPAIIAKRKGYSFILFLLVAWVISFLLALVIALLIKDRTETAESRAASEAVDKIMENETR